MKKVLFLALVTLLSFGNSAYAQFNAGTFALGGSLSYNKQRMESNVYSPRAESISFTLAPGLGLFLAENLEVGLQGSYTYTSYISEDDYIGDFNVDRLMLTPYLRKYFPLNEWSGFYLQGGLGYGWGREGGEDLSAPIMTTKTFTASIAPGIMIRLGEHLGVNFQARLLGFTHNTTERKDNVNNSFTRLVPVENLQIGPDFNNLSLGISFFL